MYWLAGGESDSDEESWGVTLTERTSDVAEATKRKRENEDEDDDEKKKNNNKE